MSPLLRVGFGGQAILRFIGTAWSFFWRQSALRPAAFLLVFLPMVGIRYLDLPSGVATPQQAAILVVLTIAGLVLLTWGVACTLTVGKRLLQAKAGRTRTSFKAVRSHAKGLIVPLILTDILRACIAILWSIPAGALAIYAMTTIDLEALIQEPFADQQPFFYLSGVCLLLLLPAWYLVRTTLAPFVVAYEKTAFREALNRSKQLTGTHMARTLLVTAALGLFWVPGTLIDLLLDRAIDPTAALIAGPIAASAFDTVAWMAWLLGLTQFYKALGGKAKATTEDDE